MFDFIVHRGGQAPQPPVDIDKIINELVAAVKVQLEAGNITPAEVQKFTAMVTDTTRLKVSKRFL
jgi:hypothetical protein